MIYLPHVCIYCLLSHLKHDFIISSFTPLLFISLPCSSLFRLIVSHPGKSVCLAFAETTIDAVKEWKNSVQGRRDADYEEYKEMVGKRMVDAICKRMPHVRYLYS